MPSAPGGSRHAYRQHPEATEQQDGSRDQGLVRSESGGDGGRNDDRQNCQGERAIVDEQSEQLVRSGSQHVHDTTSWRGRRASAWRANATAPSPTSRNSAANATIARSSP